MQGHFADNFIPVIESDVLHTQTHPFCADPSCLCHEDQEAIQMVAQDVQNGLMTEEEATRFIKGETL